MLPLTPQNVTMNWFSVLDMGVLRNPIESPGLAPLLEFLYSLTWFNTQLENQYLDCSSWQLYKNYRLGQ